MASLCGAQAPERTSSGVLAHGISCPKAHGIIPDQGQNPLSIALAGGLLTTGPPGKSWAAVSKWKRFRDQAVPLCAHMIRVRMNLGEGVRIQERGRTVAGQSGSRAPEHLVDFWTQLYLKPHLTSSTSESIEEDKPTGAVTVT